MIFGYTNPDIYHAFIYLMSSDTGWDVPKLNEVYYALGSIKWFLNSSNSVNFFSIPSSDGTMIIMHPTQDGYSSSFISTGEEYMRIKASSNGSFIYGWYPNLTHYVHNPFFISKTVSGTTITIDLQFPLPSATTLWKAQSASPEQAWTSACLDQVKPGRKAGA